MDEKEEVSSSGISKSFIFMAVLILAALVVGGYSLIGNKGSDKTADKDGQSVATVNGVAIPRSVYDAQLANAIATYKAQGVDVADADKLTAIKKEVLGVLVNNELLSQNIAASDIKITSLEVEEQFQALVTQTGGSDKFKEELAKNNLTEAQLRENISRQLAVQTYLLQNIDAKSITVSDAEISKFYADYSNAQKDAGQETVPALRDLSDQIKQQLINNKQQTMVANFITSLQGKAKIDISPTI